MNEQLKQKSEMFLRNLDEIELQIGLEGLSDFLRMLLVRVEIRQGLVHAKSIDEWHEDHGNCLWWKFPIMETPYVGSPLDVDFPIDVTHFTKFIEPIAPKG